MTSNLPEWPGADTVYLRCQVINTELCRRSYLHHCQTNKRKRVPWNVPEDVQEAIIAMKKGDEEFLKDWTYRHRDLWSLAKFTV